MPLQLSQKLIRRLVKYVNGNQRVKWAYSYLVALVRKPHTSDSLEMLSDYGLLSLKINIPFWSTHGDYFILLCNLLRYIRSLKCLFIDEQKKFQKRWLSFHSKAAEIINKPLVAGQEINQSREHFQKFQKIKKHAWVS